MVLPEVAHVADVLAQAWAGAPPSDAASRARCRQLITLLRRHDPALAADGATPDPARLQRALADAARLDPSVRTLVTQLAPPPARPSPSAASTNGTAALEAISRFLDPAPPPPPCILFVAASPADMQPLRLGEEQREIREVLALTGGRYALETVTAVRTKDLVGALSQLRPRIVHFAGHGKANGALCLEDEYGDTHPVRPEALAFLFQVLEGEVECVFLNTCYSQRQAEAIARHVKYVVGMKERVDDEAAVAFARGFYHALGGGRSVVQAFGIGQSSVYLKNLPEDLAPVLLQDGAAVA
jgi:hypothetical protein